MNSVVHVMMITSQVKKGVQAMILEVKMQGINWDRTNKDMGVDDTVC
jgi:hypothetical protein